MVLILKKFLRSIIFVVAALLIAVTGVGSLNSQPASAMKGATFPRCGSILGYTSIRTFHANLGTSYYYQQLSNGSRNSCVKDLQSALNKYFCSPSTRLTVDGSYGSNTARAVFRYQESWGDIGVEVYRSGRWTALTPDGVVGPTTWSVLNSPRFEDYPYNSCV
ncbi:MAG: peptidoglycan-binding protein [Candidatus Saccharimonas sp.]|nr:peptidoglycan-binding protein [Candidatus Saccharimonas sp.]